MSKRKLLVSLLCVGTVIGLASCGQTETPVETENPVVTPEVTPTPEPTETPVVIKHTITFDTNGGDELAAIEVDPGTLESLPTPTKEGYVFVSWYRNEELTDEFYLDRTIVDRDVTLYAKWEVAKYYLKQYTSLNSNPVTTKVEHGYVINNEPVIPGYKFLGWYLDEELTTPYEDTPITGDLSVYAKLELITYTVTYENNDLGVAPEEVELAALPAELPVLSAEGYNFIGWYIDEACTVEAVAGSAITEDITLYAKWEVIKYDVTFENNGLGVAPEEVELAALPAELPVLSAEGYNFIGWYTDEACTVEAVAGSAITEDVTLYAKWEVIKYDVTFENNGFGTKPEAVEIGRFENLPVLVDSEGDKFFVGWYTDEALTNAVVDGALVGEDTILYAKWVNSEVVTYVLKDTDFVVGTSDADLTIGNFTIKSGSEMRTRSKNWSGKEMNLVDGSWVIQDTDGSQSFTQSLKLGPKGNLVVKVPGDGVISIWIQNGSSDADVQKISFGKVGEEATIIEFPGKASSSPLTKVNLEVEGGCEYIIGRPSGTVDLFWAELVCTVAESEMVGFEIANEGVVDYLIGDVYDSSKISLNAVYGSGRLDPILLTDEDLVIDSSKVDFTKSGIYQVSVKYKDYEAQTIDVAIYDVTSLELGFNAIEKISNSSAGNGVYFNQTVQRIYLKDAESLDPSYLSVMAIATHPTDETKTLEFRLSTAEFELLGFDSSEAGKKEIKVTYKANNQIVEQFDVWVVDTAPSIVDNIVQVKVDKSYEGVIGAVVEQYNMFTSIQQALDYLEVSDIPGDMKKTLLISEGTYNEKIEITIPYLTIKGAGVGKTIVEWDSLYGIKDEGGFVHTTDSTQTVAVREQAINCIIEDVTFSNYWNSLDRFNNDLGANYPEHRALAMLVQADKFIMRNSELLGYQDTLELFTGRQVFENVRIAGTTDFIFGTNNTTYFKGCEIYSINSHANAGSKTDGGYITAFKGSNRGETDYVQYGAIFDGCVFTADEDVLADGNTAIGRTWGAYAAVMIMNSELGSHISIKENTEGTSTKNVRIVSMNSVNIKTCETIKFVEYNNKGAGAITASQIGVTVLTSAEEAAKYADYATIFGKNNGKVIYAEAWDPNNTEIEVDDRIYYNFNGASSETGTSYTYAQDTNSIEGKITALGGLTLDGTAGKITARTSDTQINEGAKITFDVEAGSEVIISNYSGYHNYSINGVRTVADTFSVYFEEDTTVTFEALGTVYLYSIVINPNEEAPAAATLSEIKAEGIVTNYVVGDEVSFDNVKVFAYYSDNSYVEISAGDYTLNSEAVNNAVAGSYEITISYEGKEISATLVFEDPNADPAITSNTTLSFKSASDYAAIKNNPRVTMNVTAERDNNGNYQFGGTISFMVKAGTQVIVTPYAQSKYVNYTIGAEGEINLATQNSVYTYVANEDCTVVYTGNNVGDGNYIVSIDIICPVSNETYTFGSENAAEGDYTKLVDSYGNITITNGVRDNEDSIQLSETSTMSFCVPAYSTVTVTGHSKSYGQVKILVNGITLNVESDSYGVYEFDVTEASSIVVGALNVGTEEEPAYNKSYVKAISVKTRTIIKESTTWSFNTGDTTVEDNYYVIKESAQSSVLEVDGLLIDATSGKLVPRDNEWSQFTNNTFIELIVDKDCIIIVKAYTNDYTINGVAATGTAKKAQSFEVEAGIVKILSTSDSNYISYVSVIYPHVFEENTTIDLSATNGLKIEGSTGEYEGLSIDATNGKFADNKGGWVQVNAGTIITLNVLEGAEVSLDANKSVDNFTIAIVDGVCTITCTANDYLSSIKVSYSS